MSRANTTKQDQREFARSCELLRGALNEKNRAAFDALDEDMKHIIVEDAFRDGILSYGPAVPVPGIL